jgi:hypothetical protein
MGTLAAMALTSAVAVAKLKSTEPALMASITGSDAVNPGWKVMAEPMALCSWLSGRLRSVPRHLHARRR